MTTAAQVKKMVQPLLARHGDLALVGRWIYVKPVHHFARAVLIDRMLNPEKFRPRWAVVHLFQARNFFPLNWGEWLYNESSPTPGSWKITDANISQALTDQIERRALPKLRAINTLDDYLAFVARQCSGPSCSTGHIAKSSSMSPSGISKRPGLYANKTFNVGPIGRMTRI
jgi:hypothetical protein